MGRKLPKQIYAIDGQAATLKAEALCDLLNRGREIMYELSHVRREK